MKIAADTNVLVRAVIPIRDDGSEDAKQSKRAKALLLDAASVSVSLMALCEFAWVLRVGYKFDRSEIASAIRTLLGVPKVECDRHIAEFGLHVLASGGDFADGVIAEAGFLAGADQFVSFDRRAVRLVTASGRLAAFPD